MGTLKGIWGTVKGVLGYMKVAGGWLWWLVSSSLLAFPGEWYLWVAWLGWLVLLTQPKPIDKLWGFASKGSTVGGYMYKPWSIPVIGMAFSIPFVGGILKILYFVFFWLVAILGLALSFMKITRFVVTLSAINLMVHPRMGEMLAEGDSAFWAHIGVAFGCIPLLFIWFFFLRSQKYRDEFKAAVAQHGWLKGIVFQLFRDFLPEDSGKWKCKNVLPNGKKCKHKNDPGDKFCAKCHAPNPNAEWNCSNCNKKSIPAHKTVCPICGAAKPEPQATRTPPPPNYASPASPANPASTTCQYCNAAITAGSTRCINCGAVLQGSPDNTPQSYGGRKRGKKLGW